MRRNFSESRATKGQSYSYFMSDPALAPGETIEMLVRSGADEKGLAQLRAQLTIDGAGLLEMFEGGSHDPRGTLVGATPRNRELALGSAMTVWESPTVVGDGVPLEKVVTSFGSAKTSVWELKASKRYLFRATNLGTTSVTAVLSIDFSE